MPAEEGFEPCSEIRRPMWRWHADIAQVAGAVARRDVHAPAEGDCEVCVVPADSGFVVKSFERRPCHACMFVTENDMAMNIVADRLNAAPSRWRLAKELPRR